MNKSLLYDALSDPAVLARLPVDELEQLRDSYPWFTAAHVLLAKAYQLRDDHRFTGQLRQAALMSGDRKALFHYFHAGPTALPEVPREAAEGNIPAEPVILPDTRDLPSPASPGQEGSHPVPAHAAEDASPVQPAPVAPEARDEAPPTHVPDTSLGRLAEKLMEEEMSHPAGGGGEGKAVHSIAAELPEPAAMAAADAAHDAPAAEASRPAPPPQVDVSRMDLLEKSILAEAVSSSIGLEASEWQAEDDVPDQLRAGETPSAPASRAVAAAPHADTTAEDTDDMGSWLLRRARELHYQAPPTGEASSADSPEQTARTPQPSSAGTASDTSAPAATLQPQDRKVHQRELIDRFIRTEPKISPGKSAEYDTQNIAKESLEEDFSLVTETMARLFAAQGKVERARKAYKRLMELHPEKSVYFAAQLKNLSSPKKG